MAEPITCKLCGRDFAPYSRSYHVYCRRCRAKSDRRLGRTMIVKCRVCGGGFSTAHPLACYCSDKCRAEARRRADREYHRRYSSDPKKRALVLARGRATAAAHADRERGGRRRPAGRAAGRLSRNQEASTAVCEMCGRSFAQYGGTIRVHCRRCTAKADRDIGRVLRANCKECGRAFSATSRTIRYCSKACSSEGSRRSRTASRRRTMADPERRAVAAARTRAWNAAQRGRKRRRSRRQRA